MSFIKLLLCCHSSTTSASDPLQPRPVELQQDKKGRYSSGRPNYAASEYGKSIAFSAAISIDSDGFPTQRSLGTLAVLNPNQSIHYSVGPKYGRAS
ncbi:uncharacterized protein BKA55DRAFT_558642 [Fusarium redolens]|jgi:hypothetical protein|uniref:Uncharacterized protein n=1 Tax=Fusarium redolens TaxID=48865 RepID=A0A9P9HXC1_FUSRE|nr:uncharacterized protein BKA55DRAFT_558642 [Fusarium redolens]KAH7265330.1 hypothetical protein BKA55DRAFT_558642 [Fusarium redolens]